MDGSMGVQSEVGKGSLFWFTAVFKRAASPQPSFPALSRAITALLVAQNETLRNKLLRYLEAFGLHPTCVSSFEEAEAVCRDREFDLNIASCEIVGGAGFQADCAGPTPQGQRSPDLDRLHATMRTLAGILQRRPRMRCIVLCPITQLSHCAAYKEACGFTLMSRPVRLAGFHQALVEAAEYAGPAAAAAAAAATPAAVAAGIAAARAEEAADRVSSAEAAARAEAVEAAVSEGSRRLRVLVVDDDAGQRMVVKMMLVREGYEVRAYSLSISLSISLSLTLTITLSSIYPSIYLYYTEFADSPMGAGGRGRGRRTGAQGDGAGRLRRGTPSSPPLFHAHTSKIFPTRYFRPRSSIPLPLPLSPSPSPFLSKADALARTHRC
jgi:CheY-like chemotaxis protein